MNEEEVKELYQKEGYILLDEYKGKRKYNTVEKDGYKFRVYLENWLRGYRPNIVDKRNPYSIENIKNFIKKNNIDVELLSNEYISNKSHLLLKCHCGKEYNASWTHFRNGNNWNCKECSSRIFGESRKIEDKEIRNRVIKSGFIPVFEKYINSNVPIKIMTKEGYFLNVMINNIENINKGLIFSPKNPYTIDNINTYLRKKCIKTKLLSKDYCNSKKYLLWECECGKIFKTSWGCFLAGKTRCNTCTSKNSKLELLVEDYLSKNGLKYIREYKFPDCKSKRELSFDFKIEVNGELRLIEVDGILHYKPRHEKEELSRLEGQKERDKIKNEYCKKNNIRLLRIPYWEFKNDNYKNILNNFIKE